MSNLFNEEKCDRESTQARAKQLQEDQMGRQKMAKDEDSIPNGIMYTITLAPPDFSKPL